MEKAETITINDAGLNRHLERVKSLGLYGSSISEVAATLIRNQLMEMICGDEIDQVETFIAETVRQERSSGGVKA